MKKYIHDFDLVIAIKTEIENLEDVPIEQLIDAAQKRLDSIKRNPVEAREAFGHVQTNEEIYMSMRRITFKRVFEIIKGADAVLAYGIPTLPIIDDTAASFKLVWEDDSHREFNYEFMDSDVLGMTNELVPSEDDQTCMYYVDNGDIVVDGGFTEEREFCCEQIRISILKKQEVTA